MAQSYTRQSSIADGDTITAALFNNEYNQLLNAFAYSSSSASSTGHRHDGTAGQGGNVPQIGDLDFLNKVVVDSTNNRVGFFVEVSSSAVEQVRVQDGAIVPVTDNDIDLGTSSLEFKDGYFDGTVYADAINFNGTAISATAAELNIMDGVTATATELNILDGVTSTAAELNILDGVTSTAAELNILDGVTSTAAELNILDGVTASATDLNLIDGITNGTVIASKAIITDSDKDITGGRNITISGELDAATLDISGDADIDGTLEADAITIAGVTLSETISDTVGAMVSSNTETNITVTYEDSDNTLDFVIGTLNQDTTGTAALATTVTLSANNSTDETIFPVFADGATGTQGLETDTGFTYNPSSGKLTATEFVGNIDAVDGDFDGTLETDALSIGGTTVTSTAAELNILDGVTSTAAELNILDGVTASATDLNLIDGITNGTVIASKAIVTDSNKDISGGRNITISGELDAATLDISGDADIDGTLEADAITVNGTALASVIAGTTVTLASTATVSDSTANTNFPVVFHNESNALLDDTGALRYNPSTGTLLVPNLNVAGTTTQVDTVTMEASNAIIFEGATSDAHETTLTVVDPTGDRTIGLPNVSGTLPVLAAASTTQITSTPEELNILDGVTSTAAELNILDGVTSTAAELNILDGVTSTAAELNILDGVTSTAAELNILDGVTATATELNFIDGGATVGTTAVADGDGIIHNDAGTMKVTSAATFKTYFQSGISSSAAADDISAGDAAVSITTSSGNITIDAAANDSDIIFKGTDDSSDITMLTLDGSDAGSATFNDKIIVGDGKLVLNSTAVTSTGAELNILDGVTSTTAELNILDGVTSTAAELNILDGVTSTAAELNILDGVTSTATELNILDGVTSTAAELNILDGVTASAADLNLIDGITNGTVIASKAIITDSNKDISGGRNITITGELDAATGDFSGDVDIAGAFSVTGGNAITNTFFADSGSNEGSVNFTLNTDGASTNQSVANILMRQGSGDGGSRKGEMLFQVSDNGAPATAITVANNKATTFAGAVTADSGVSIDNITIDGTEIDLSSGDLTIDVAGDIRLDAGGGDVFFIDDGTHMGTLKMANSNLTLDSQVADKDIIFSGNDGGAAVTALTLDMSAAGAATFNNNVTAYSDERLKDNIETLENGLDKVEQLRGVTYTRNDKENIGVIAQEVEKVLPEIVLTADDEMKTKSVDYSRITAVLIEAVKELSDRVKELENK